MANKPAQAHMDKVAALCCIACRNSDLGDTPAGCHHIRDGQGRGQRASDYETLPLCGIHHQTGDGKRGSGFQIALHYNQPEFEARHGTERELLLQVYQELGETYCRAIEDILMLEMTEQNFLSIKYW